MQQRLGKYQLVRKLAVGGMAEVYLARAEGPMGFAKTLVLKRILPHLAEDQQFIDMFLGEAKLAAQLNHPNIVQIFDFGEADGQYFIAMEYIDGPNLRALCRRAAELSQKLPFALAAKTISFACEGLAYAHDFCDSETGEHLNLIHRDISPDNILLSRNGGVKVVDFGIAKAAGQGHHTKTGTVKGKLAYMPPEQLGGKGLDKRVDIFALGIVLYELICGEKPFDASSEVAIMRAILYEPLAPASSKRPELPKQLSDILEKALAKDREQRYPDCRELQAELERFILATGEPSGAYQLSQLVATLAAQPGANPATTPPVAGSGPKSKPGIPAPPQRTPSNPNVPPAPRTPSNPNLAVAPPRQRSNPNSQPNPPPPADAGADFQIAEGTAMTAAVPPPVAGRQPQNGTAVTAALGGQQPPAQPARLPLIFSAAALVIALGIGAMLYVKSQSTSVDPVPTPTPTEKPAGVAKLDEPENVEVQPQPVVETPAVLDAGAPTQVAEVVQPEVVEEQPQPKETTKDKKGKGKTKAIIKPVVAREQPANTTVAAKPETQSDAKSTAASASFEVVSEPPGQVRVNGKFVGASGSARVMNLSPGEVRVEVYDSRMGFSKTQTFNVSAGDNGVKKIVVEKGVLDIRVRPYATVFLDGKPIGETPLGPQAVYEGKHELKLVNRDLKYEKSFDVVVKPGAPTTFKKNLEEGD